MAGSTITSTLHAAIVLGQGGYNGPLTITSKGALLAPNNNGATALYVRAGTQHATVSNAGTVTGGSGLGYGSVNGFYGNGYAGGVGLKAMAAVTILNTGEIEGGAGGVGITYGGFGNIGVYLGGGGDLVNDGRILGGSGGSGYVFSRPDPDNGFGGGGGDAVVVAGAATVENLGIIYGGAGGGGGRGNESRGGDGGIGAALESAGASLASSGLIHGGYGGYRGGDGGTGVVATAGKITNTGNIDGGRAGPAVGSVVTAADGGIGVSIADGARLINRGTIMAGDGGRASDGAFNDDIDDQGGAGGVGLVLDRAFTSNIGVILGGVGADSQFSGVGGGGALVTFGSLVNQGSIEGGAGGEGFDPPLPTGNQAVNGASGGIGAAGGAGIVLTGGTTENIGRISGGTGGAGGVGANGNRGVYGAPDGGYGGSGGAGGNGGDGAQVIGGILLNSGVIVGGNGGIGGNGGTYGSAASGGRTGENGLGGRGGYGLFGVYLDGGTLINAGTISGGAGGANGVDAIGAPNSARADAVFLGAAKSVLIVETGAVFVGGIIAENNADVSEFSGTSKNAFRNFGGFGTIEFDAGASWTIAGSAANLAAGQTITGFAPGDAIALDTAAAAAGKVTVNRAGVVTIKAGGDIYKLDIGNAVKGATNYVFANFTLTEKPTAMAFLAPPASAARAPMPMQAAPCMVGQAPPPVFAFGTAMMMGAPDFMLAPHRFVETMVTLHAG